MWNNRFFKHTLQAPPLQGMQALVAGILIVAAPTLLRASVGEVVTIAVFLTYVPFVMIAAVLLKPATAAAVALVCALSADYLFMKPYLALAVTPDDLFGMGILLLISAMMITLMVFVRRYLAHCLDPPTDDYSRRVIFSEREGEAWAHWDGKRPSVKLGPHKTVAEMMEDYVAQVELGERLTGKNGNDDAP